jgi:hypothetical protein
MIAGFAGQERTRAVLGMYAHLGGQPALNAYAGAF